MRLRLNSLEGFALGPKTRRLRFSSSSWNSSRSTLPPRPLSSTSPSGRVRLPPARSTRGSDDGRDGMIGGVHENDKQEFKRRRELKANDREKDKLFVQLASQVDGLGGKISTFGQEISQQLRHARWDARAEFRIKPHAEAEWRLMNSANATFHGVCEPMHEIAKTISNRLELQIWASRQTWMELYQRKIKPLELGLDEVEANLDVCNDLLVRHRNLRPMWSKYVLTGAQSLSQEISLIKGSGGEHDRHRKLGDSLFQSSMELAALLQESSLRLIEIELIESGTWKPRHKGKRLPVSPDYATNESVSSLFKTVGDKIALVLFKIYLVSLELGGQAVNGYNSVPEDMRKLCHEIRDLEFHMRMARHLPQVTLADRSRLVSRAAYMWPWSHDNLRFWIFVNRMFLDCSRYTRPSRIAYLALFATNYSKKVRKLTAELESTIMNGTVSRWRHPSEVTRLGRKSLVHLIDKQARHWDVCIDSAREVVDTFSTSSNTPSIPRLEGFLNTIEIGSENNDRASYAHLRQQLMIWNGARLLTQGPLYRGAAQPDSNNLYHIDEARNIRGVNIESASNVEVPPQPMMWLQTRSLYPSADPVIINYVTSCHTLQQVMIELHNERVVSLDIIESRDIGLWSDHIEYVVLANEHQIYILDSVLLSAEDGPFFRTVLTELIERAPVLKIIFDSRKLDAMTWKHVAITSRQTYDIAQHAPISDKRELGDTTILMRLLEQQFGPVPILEAINMSQLEVARRRSPVLFFSYLATRAYSLLRLFHFYNQGKTVYTTDTFEVFDISRPCRTDYDQQSNRLADPQLGPVCIDAAPGAFTPVKWNARHGGSANVTTNFRKKWMRGMARQMAINFLNSAQAQVSKLYKNAYRGSVTSEKVIDSFAAFYLATTFCQTLRTIENFMGVHNPAQWILWAAQTGRADGLQLHRLDETKFRDAAGSFNIDSERMLARLTRTSSYRGPMQRATQPSRSLPRPESTSKFEDTTGAAKESDISPGPITATVKYINPNEAMPKYRGVPLQSSKSLGAEKMKPTRSTAEQISSQTRDRSPEIKTGPSRVPGQLMEALGILKSKQTPSRAEKSPSRRSESTSKPVPRQNGIPTPSMQPQTSHKSVSVELNTHSRSSTLPQRMEPGGDATQPTDSTNQLPDPKGGSSITPELLFRPMNHSSTNSDTRESPFDKPMSRKPLIRRTKAMGVSRRVSRRPPLR